MAGSAVQSGTWRAARDDGLVAPFDQPLFYRRFWARARALTEAGLAGVRFHNLRHTLREPHGAGGRAPYRVAKHLGHADATITLAITPICGTTTQPPTPLDWSVLRPSHDVVLPLPERRNREA